MQALEEYSQNNCKIQICRDPYPMTPDWSGDLGCTVVHWHRRYAIFGQKERVADTECPAEACESLPIYMLDHSGVRFSSSPFGCPWDSGQVGWIYFTKEEILHTFGGKRVTKKKREAARKYLEAVIKEWDDYSTGNVYGYVVTTPDGKEDSAWGFVGDIKYCKEEAEAVARFFGKGL